MDSCIIKGRKNRFAEKRGGVAKKVWRGSRVTANSNGRHFNARSKKVPQVEEVHSGEKGKEDKGSLKRNAI